MRLWRSLLGRGTTATLLPAPEKRFSLADYASLFSFNGIPYSTGATSLAGGDFVALTRQAYQRNGIVFACMMARQLVFSEARFMWQQQSGGEPGQLFGTEELQLLQQPWPGGSTSELLTQMLQDVDLAGNFYAVRDGDRLRRLRPDWVEVVLAAPPDQAVRSDVKGYRYHPGGIGRGDRETPLYGVDQVAHWFDAPDPIAPWRGMSWLTPILDEVDADSAATTHKNKFFQNAAVPNLAVSLSSEVTAEQFREFMTEMNATHAGADNAWKTLYLGGGADVKVIGSDMQAMDFRSISGASETRIAAAARVHPVVVGLSEGLQGSSLNAGNFNSTRRSFADGTLRPLWHGAAQALEPLLTKPNRGARLWYDVRHVAYLQEDRKDIAEIQQAQAQAIRTLVDAGYEPDTAVTAVMTDNLGQLDHTGLFSVQLMPPSEMAPDGDGEGEGEQ